MARNNGNALTVRSNENVARWNPWAEFDRMHRYMDDLFASLMGYTPLSRMLGSTAFVGDPELSPDVFETDEEIVFVVPLPGINPEDLHIEATTDTISIRGERKPFYQAENAVQHRQSLWTARGTGTFQISYTLPVEINPNKVEANYRNGVLEVHLPKAEAVKPKTVKINVNK
ncbi:molecular chaperone (small heat shock protein) [Chthonomonas calidirosea]|uniref:Hsp20/alpha crystallin family protein n=1 Tax=Chthonomonas calidirosea TaxID=454171 RepID=UPI0006DD46AA|nr:Hsp20/alpha crystallin family protein [Chthonomonas calidirosea]CEK16817.1 molecular chaperone (small heat shock protein) [Chthonomonas calidirosea]